MLQEGNLSTDGISTGLSGVPTKGGLVHSLEFDASQIVKEDCMLIMLTSLVVV